MPEIFKIAREFDQKRYICPFFKKKSLKFRKTLYIPIVTYGHTPLYFENVPFVIRFYSELKIWALWKSIFRSKNSFRLDILIKLFFIIFL